MRGPVSAGHRLAAPASYLLSICLSGRHESDKHDDSGTGPLERPKQGPSRHEQALRSTTITSRDEELWPVFQRLHEVIAAELRARGEDDGETRLVLDHGGHEVWTDDQGTAGATWSVMCDCGWVLNGLPSQEAARAEGDLHVEATGGRWEGSA